MNQHVVGILVVYSSYAYRAISEFSQLLQGISPSCDIIIVCNSELPLSHDGSFKLVKGTNTNAEFSGWDEGLHFVRNNLPNSVLLGSVFVFANDTFCHHRPWGSNVRSHYVQKLQDWCKSSPNTAFGFIDSSPVPLLVSNIKISSWMSTFFFGLRYETLASLGWQLSPSSLELSELLPAKGISITEFFGTQLDPSIRNHLVSWLFGTKRPCWSKAEPLTVDSLPKLKLKSSAILSEKILSTRLKVLKTSFYPVNYWRYVKGRLVHSFLYTIRLVADFLRLPGNFK